MCIALSTAQGTGSKEREKKQKVCDYFVQTPTLMFSFKLGLPHPHLKLLIDFFDSHFVLEEY